jgi:hypothetical protein
MEVTLVKGKTNLFTKKFKYEKTVDESETIFQLQFVTMSIL